MNRSFGVALSLALALASTASAQQPRPSPDRPRTPSAATPEDRTPPPPAPPPVAGPSTKRQGQPVNIKVEFTITDQRGNAAPIKRIVSLVVADAHTGMVRSQSQLYQRGDVPLNVDTSPELLADGKIRLGFNIQYDWPVPVEAQSADRPFTTGAVTKTAIHDSVAVILESGKPMVAAQSADPIGDRQVTVEVKATVLK